jgi:hypothetical protein
MARPEVYVSTDIETDGPIPAMYSMLSLASAAFLADGKLVDTFTVNLIPLDGAIEHPETMAFWQSEPDARSRCSATGLIPGSP